MTRVMQQEVHVPDGMPPLDTSGRTTSFFEFWPLWLMYLPVALQWLLLSLRYRSFTLPLIANPAMPLSGMVGVPKTAILKQAGPRARECILPWVEYEVTGAPALQQTYAVRQLMAAAGLNLPIVAKPNVGCRGAGVKLLESDQQLENYLAGFPLAGSIQFQRLAEWEAEAGVFYVRHPDTSTGTITSLTLKYMPYVVGDGVSTLAELVSKDPRASQVQHLYCKRHAHRWQEVLPEGQPYRLVFSASHCRGAVFRNGNAYATEQLTRTLDALFDDIPGFHYGRLDIKFRDLDSLMQGEGFSIIEINGASSESIHIWDRNTAFTHAISTLLRQYRTLFALGDANRRRGHRPPGLLTAWQAWRLESNLVRQYPAND